MEKWNISTDRAERIDQEKGNHSSRYVYSQTYGHQNVKISSFYVLTAEYSKSLFGQDI